MIEEHFLALDRNDKCPYNIEDSAQIEPTHPEDPDEIFRMTRKRSDDYDLVFDAIFFPDCVGIFTVGGGKISDIKNDEVSSPRELFDHLESLDIFVPEQLR